MKKKEKRRESSDLDRFDRKQKKGSSHKQKDSSKGKFSIYDNFDDQDLTNSNSDFDELED